MSHLDEAAQTLEVAKDGARQRQERPLLWPVHRSLGRVYHRMKDEDRAERAFAAARSIIAELAASINEPTLRELFSQEALKSLPREKPIPERRVAAERFGGLTEREREVAMLIAQGKTNREIADTLVVSHRTVETHVSTILSKLGVSSHSQIAVWAVEVGLVKDGLMAKSSSSMRRRLNRRCRRSISVLAPLAATRTGTPIWAHVHNLRTAFAESPYFSTMANPPFSSILLVTVGIR